MKVDTEDLIKQSTAGRMRGVSTQAIVLLVKRGKLRKVVIDGDVFVYKKEVENFIPGTAGRPKKSEKAKPRSRRSS